MSFMISSKIFTPRRKGVICIWKLVPMWVFALKLLVVKDQIKLTQLSTIKEQARSNSFNDELEQANQIYDTTAYTLCETVSVE